MLLALGLGLLVILVGPLVIVSSERLFAPAPDVADEFHRYLAIRLFGAPAALANMVLLGWLLGLQDFASAAAADDPHQRHQRGPGAPARIRPRPRDQGRRHGDRARRIFRAGARPLAGRRANWRRLGGWPGWPALLIAARFRRLLAVNRDLFLRSLLLEAAFLTFAAIGSRQGPVVLAANAVLMNFFTAAAYGLDGFAHAAEAMVGRDGRRARRPGLSRRRPGELRQRGPAGAADDRCLRRSWAARGVRLMTGLAEVRAQALAFLPYIVALPLVSVWAFVFDGIYFGATRTAELRNGMVVALALFLACAALLVPAFGNHGLWLTFLAFLAARAVVLALIYRRIERTAPVRRCTRRGVKNPQPNPLARPQGAPKYRLVKRRSGSRRSGSRTWKPGLRPGGRHGRSRGGLVMRGLDLSPLFRSTVGFDHLDKLFETALREAGRDVSYPPYNIAKVGQDKYRISMAVAGFGERDLDITTHENVLTVKGQISEPENGVEYLHRGIAQRAFEHRFQLADHVKVVGAKLSNGLLDVELAARGARGDEAAQDRDRRCARTAARDRQQGGLTGQPTAPSGQRVGAAGDRREGARAPSLRFGDPPPLVRGSARGL